MGKLADSELVTKFGIIFWSQIGEANAAIPIVWPIFGGPMWGRFPASAALNFIVFVSGLSISTGGYLLVLLGETYLLACELFSIVKGTVPSYHLSKRFEPVNKCREVTKKRMKWNNASPKMAVSPECYTVHTDDVLMAIPAAEKVPLTWAYYRIWPLCVMAIANMYQGSSFVAHRPIIDIFAFHPTSPPLQRFLLYFGFFSLSVL